MWPPPRIWLTLAVLGCTPEPPPPVTVAVDAAPADPTEQVRTLRARGASWTAVEAAQDALAARQGDPFELHAETARALAAEGEWALARSAWQLAAEADPARASTAHAALADLALRTGDLVAHAAALERSEATPQAALGWAIHAALLGDRRGAIARLEALTQDEVRAPAARLRAALLAEASEFAAATTALRDLAVEPPLAAQVRCDLGWISLRGMVAGAIPMDLAQPLAHLQAARPDLPLPDRVRASAGLAWVMLVAGQPHAVELLVDEVRALDPEDATGLRDLASLAWGQALLDQGEPKRAAAAFLRLEQRLLGPKRAPSPDLLARALLGQGQALRAQGIKRKAAKTLRRAVLAWGYRGPALDLPQAAAALPLDPRALADAAVQAYLDRGQTSFALSVADAAHRWPEVKPDTFDLGDRRSDPARARAVSSYLSLLRRHHAERHGGAPLEGEPFTAWRKARKAARHALDERWTALTGYAAPPGPIKRRSLQRKLGRRALFLVHEGPDARVAFWLDRRGIDHRAVAAELSLGEWRGRAERASQVFTVPTDARPADAPDPVKGLPSAAAIP